jgi:hypothetical protein
MLPICSTCGHECESPRELADHIEARHFNRGRRFFLMGALPLAKKIELAAAPAVQMFTSGATVTRWHMRTYSIAFAVHQLMASASWRGPSPSSPGV